MGDDISFCWNTPLGNDGSVVHTEGKLEKDAKTEV